MVVRYKLYETDLRFLYLGNLRANEISREQARNFQTVEEAMQALGITFPANIAYKLPELVEIIHNGKLWRTGKIVYDQPRNIAVYEYKQL